MLDEAFTLKRYGVSPALALSSFVARRASLVDIGLLFCGQHSGLAVFSVNSHIISFACNNMNPFRAEGLREAQYNCRCDALVESRCAGRDATTSLGRQSTETAPGSHGRNVSCIYIIYHMAKWATD